MRKIIIVVLTMCLTHVVYGQETKERDILSSEKNLLSEKVESKLISNEENKCFHHGKIRKSSGLIESKEIEVIIGGQTRYFKIFVVCNKVGDRCIIDGNIIEYYDNSYIGSIDTGTYHIEHGPNGWELGCGGNCFPAHLMMPMEIFLLFRAFVDFPNSCCEEEECYPIMIEGDLQADETINFCADYEISCCGSELKLEYDIYICGTNILMASNKMKFIYSGNGDMNEIDFWKMPDRTDIPEEIKRLLRSLIEQRGIDLNLCNQGQ